MQSLRDKLLQAGLVTAEEAARSEKAKASGRDESPQARERRRELRRLYLTEAQVAALEKGELAVVDRPNGNERPHALVPRAVAEKVLALEAKAIRFWARSGKERYGFDDEPAPAEG